MPAHFCVIQYLPDPVTGECINIGIIAYDGSRIKSHFLGNWRRVQRFGGQDIDFLKSFKEEIEENLSPNLHLPNLPGNSRLDASFLSEMSQNWANSIQVTAPRGSLLEIDELITYISGRYLREPVTERRKFRPRTSAASLAREYVTSAINSKYGPGEVEHFLSRSQSVLGRLERHPIDVSIGNGQLIAIAQGLSFEGPDTPERSDTITKTAYALEDIIRKYKTKVQATVIVLPPLNKSKDYERAAALFPKINAQIVMEDSISGWAHEVVKRLPPPLANLTPRSEPQSV